MVAGVRLEPRDCCDLDHLTNGVRELVGGAVAAVAVGQLPHHLFMRGDVRLAHLHAPHLAHASDGNTFLIRSQHSTTQVAGSAFTQYKRDVGECGHVPRHRRRVGDVARTLTHLPN